MTDGYYQIGQALKERKDNRAFQNSLSEYSKAKSNIPKLKGYAKDLKKDLQDLQGTGDTQAINYFQSELDKVQSQMQQPNQMLQRLAQINPKATQNYLTIQDRIQKEQQAEQQAEQRRISTIASTILNTPEEERANIYQYYRQKEIENGADPDTMPEQYGAEADFELRQLRNEGRDIEKVYTGGVQESQFGEKQEFERQKFQVQEGEKTREKLVDIQKELSGKSFQNSMDLRKEFTKNSGDFIKVRDSFNRIKAVTKDPSAAGDVATIFNFMKMLDPGSTVREGEFATAAKAAGLSDRMINYANKVDTGERLTIEQRADFVRQADILYKSQLSSHKKIENQFKKIAKRNNINEDDVILDVVNGDGEKIEEKPLAPISKLSLDELLEMKKKIQGNV